MLWAYTWVVVEVAVNAFEVGLELRNWDAVLALKRNLVLPVSAITAVYPAKEVGRPPVLRVPGTSIPGVVQAGTFIGRGLREFWCIHYSGNSVVFDLTNFLYTRVVVDVRDPEAVVQRVRAAMTGRL